MTALAAFRQSIRALQELRLLKAPPSALKVTARINDELEQSRDALERLLARVRELGPHVSYTEQLALERQIERAQSALDALTVGVQKIALTPPD